MQSASGRIPIWIYEINDHIDRAWFVENVELVSDDELWQNLLSESFNPLSKAYVTSGKSRSVQGSKEITSSKYLPNEINIEVNSELDGFLVVSEVYYPLRWKAYIDSVEVETIETNGILRGLWIEDGNHTVEFKYDKSVFNKGKSISFIATILALGVIAIGFVKLKK